ncbi:MAG: 16S rRNA (guanine(527)-N(7))-methyltransferase RsmG [Oscillospiraceae bacterium]|jgi:16S rRNA (guanine527-N7)-methyltransferase|nr:16S rRNA (guanine(527)-N(7))-methyltransferase RsmG [Oscillospiraceae bacterium]
MDKALLRALAADIGITLDAQALRRFEIYESFLLEENQKYNLTAVTDSREVLYKHFFDSLTVVGAYMEQCSEDGAMLPIWSNAPSLLDVGSGAGFPGMCLGIAYPEWRITLLDSTGKKCRFLEALAERLALPNIRVICGRAEELGHDTKHREQYDIVTARAVARLTVLAEYCLPFCKVGGICLWPKGERAAEEIAAARDVISELGGNSNKIIAKVTKQTPLADKKCTIFLKKIRPTPTKYPRKQADITKSDKNR